jgi:mannose-6-phosphate isomerase-like protein (cupin superfamily)
VGKILHIKAGEALSVQYHERKDETVYLLSGELIYRVALDGGELRDVRLMQGESFRITPHTVHQMEAVTDCDVLEASTPELDDVVRLTDRYGREGTSAP